MLHKCANPGCENKFRKLTQGKLFLVEAAEEQDLGPLFQKKERSRRIEHYWLCDQCAHVLTLAYERGRGIVAVPLSKPPVKIALAIDELTVRENPYFERSLARRA